MFGSNRVFNVRNIIHEMANACAFALTLASLKTNAGLFSVAYAEQALIIEHHIQSKSQSST